MEKLDFAIIASRKDAAGMNICDALKRMLDFPAVINGRSAGIFLTDEEITHCENIDKEVNAETLIFASRHVSMAGVNSLTVHSIGNWGRAELGGKDRSIVSCPSLLLKNCLSTLEKEAAEKKLGYEVIQEATHHGPYVGKPAMFIEIGSSEKQWKDEAAGKIVAAAIIDSIKDYGSKKIKAAVGIGGLHYGYNFKRIMLNPDFAVSYICPKHMLSFLDVEMLRQAMEKSVPQADSVLLDWKGLGQEKQRIVRMLENAGIKYARAKDL